MIAHPMESFFKTMKVEEVYQKNYRTRDEAKQNLFDYIEIFYNRQRLHSTLGYDTPEAFEANAVIVRTTGYGVYEFEASPRG